MLTEKSQKDLKWALKASLLEQANRITAKNERLFVKNFIRNEATYEQLLNLAINPYRDQVYLESEKLEKVAFRIVEENLETSATALLETYLSGSNLTEDSAQPHSSAPLQPDVPRFGRITKVQTPKRKITSAEPIKITPGSDEERRRYRVRTPKASVARTSISTAGHPSLQRDANKAPIKRLTFRSPEEKAAEAAEAAKRSQDVLRSQARATTTNLPTTYVAPQDVPQRVDKGDAASLVSRAGEKWSQLTPGQKWGVGGGLAAATTLAGFLTFRKLRAMGRNRKQAALAAANAAKTPQEKQYWENQANR